MTGVRPIALVSEPGSHWLVAHATTVLLLSALFAVTSFSAEEPNIGAGFLALPLLLVGLPWTGAGWFTNGGAALPFDALVVGAACLNVTVHAALRLALSSGVARAPAPAAPGGRRLMVVTVFGVAAPLVVLSATGVAAERNEASLGEQAQQLLPLAPWTEGSTRVPSFTCLFCAPQSLSTSSVQIIAPPPSEPELLAGIVGQLQERGAAPEGSWDCADLPLGPGEFGAEEGAERRRQCLRLFATDRASIFVEVTFYRDPSIDPELRLDVTKA